MRRSNVPPLPAQHLEGFHRYNVSLAKRLHRLALKAERSEVMFDVDPRASSQWLRLHRAMVETASELEHLIWTEWTGTKAECLVIKWINRIYPSDKERSRWVRGAISGLSPDHFGIYQAFEETAETWARLVNGPILSRDALPQRWEEDGALSNKLRVLAEGAGQLQPITPGDRQFQRLVIEYLHSERYVFARRYRV